MIFFVRRCIVQCDLLWYFVADTRSIANTTPYSYKFGDRKFFNCYSHSGVSSITSGQTRWRPEVTAIYNYINSTIYGIVCINSSKFQL